jgi:hypothetical protein
MRMGTLGIALLACRPVLAIGWEEILFVAVLLAFLFGPPLFRLYRWVQKFKEDPDKKDDLN